MPNSSTFHELHSTEVQDLISRQPAWVIRWGVTLLFIVFTILLIASWIIKYPDVVSTSFILSANDAPRKVISRGDGKITKMLVRDGQLVKKGQILAYGESIADPLNVLEIEESLTSIYAQVVRVGFPFLERCSFRFGYKLFAINSSFFMASSVSSRRF
ncbi:Biotin-lipoyl like [Dyadobacter psychrophilus]|uniref:Biotin-lipoyl like n=1 Tax=Dyadobacter psychrophilus TaxID=651661 RepID=A0A1T5HDG2_9BACT|nr:Biotin-lipoyl like [Dyadobacter psychrophilus]